jgi:hypothetical protein
LTLVRCFDSIPIELAFNYGSNVSTIETNENDKSNQAMSMNSGSTLEAFDVLRNSSNEMLELIRTTKRNLLSMTTNENRVDRLMKLAIATIGCHSSAASIVKH